MLDFYELVQWPKAKSLAPPASNPSWRPGAYLVTKSQARKVCVRVTRVASLAAVPLCTLAARTNKCALTGCRPSPGLPSLCLGELRQHFSAALQSRVVMAERQRSQHKTQKNEVNNEACNDTGVPTSRLTDETNRQCRKQRNGGTNGGKGHRRPNVETIVLVHDQHRRPSVSQVELA